MTEEKQIPVKAWWVRGTATTDYPSIFIDEHDAELWNRLREQAGIKTWIDPVTIHFGHEPDGITDKW